MDKYRTVASFFALAFFGLLAVGSDSSSNHRSAPTPPPPHIAQAEEQRARAATETRYDLIDMVKSDLADAALVDLSSDWPERIPRESRILSAFYRWKKRPSGELVGPSWELADPELKIQFNAPTATGQEQDSCEDGSVKAQVGMHFGCYYAEPKHGKKGSYSDGAAVMWSNNLATVKRGAMRGHTKEELINVAAEAAQWQEQFLPGGMANAKIDQTALQQNRRALDQVLDRFGPKPKPSAWDGMISQVKQYLKEHLNDPDFDSNGCSEPVRGAAGWETTCRYRAKNGFGAKILQETTFIINKTGAYPRERAQ